MDGKCCLDTVCHCVVLYWLNVNTRRSLKQRHATVQSPNWFFGQCRADHFLENFFVLVSVTAHDPDKPIISALGFLGKLPGGKCFSLLMQPLSNTRFQKVEFLSKNPKISINFLISNFQLKILNFLNHMRFQFGEKMKKNSKISILKKKIL